MKTYNVRIKEYGNDHILTPSITTNKGYDYVVEWFGLNNPDVEWYEISVEE